jgi:hypothetical protein
MQISTRTEDFVVDTLKLRIHIGQYLREVFKDPTKRKVDLLHAWIFFCFVSDLLHCVMIYVIK